MSGRVGLQRPGAFEGGPGVLSEIDRALALIGAAHWTEQARCFRPAIGLAAALGLHGDVDEAKTILAAAIKLRAKPIPVKQYHARPASWDATPEFVALRQNTIDVCLPRAGLPEGSVSAWSSKWRNGWAWALGWPN